MSYCVNCGVELDRSAKACPLCNTPVINPNELLRKEQKTPFPQEKGQVETVNKKDMGILMTVLVIATAVTCGLLNAFVFTGAKWSLAVIGVCAILWVIMIPVVIYTRLSIYLYFLLDGMVVGIYLYMLTFLTRESAWFWGLGLPLVGLVTFLVEELTVCIRKLPRSFLTVAMLSSLAICPLSLRSNRRRWNCSGKGYKRSTLLSCFRPAEIRGFPFRN